MGIRSCHGIYISILQDNGQKSKTEIHHRRTRSAPLVCHPERSEAESKDLGTAPTQGRPRRPVQNAPIITPIPGECAPRPRRGGYHPPAQRAPNPHAVLRRIRSAFCVGGDDLGAPLPDACRNPAHSRGLESFCRRRDDHRVVREMLESLPQKADEQCSSLRKCGAFQSIRHNENREANSHLGRIRLTFLLCFVSP